MSLAVQKDTFQVTTATRGEKVPPFLDLRRRRVDTSKSIDADKIVANLLRTGFLKRPSRNNLPFGSLET